MILVWLEPLVKDLYTIQMNDIDADCPVMIESEVSSALGTKYIFWGRKVRVGIPRSRREKETSSSDTSRKPQPLSGSKCHRVLFGEDFFEQDNLIRSN